MPPTVATAPHREQEGFAMRQAYAFRFTKYPKGRSMYIGGGAVVLILIVILILVLMRRR
jgi:hypothetical protein